VHEIPSRELFFGLLGFGRGRPDQVTPKAGVKTGDLLVVTKPLGTGVVSTMEKRSALRAGDPLHREALEAMMTLNAPAASVVADFPGVSAVTDITGFSLIGHLMEMVAPRGGNGALGARVWVSEVPVLGGDRLSSLLDSGLDFCSLARNRHHLEPQVRTVGRARTDAERTAHALLFDAQTSGGLLVAVDSDRGSALIDALREAGVEKCRVVGRIEARGSAPIEIAFGDPGFVS